MTARARGIGSQIAAGVAWMVLMRLAIRMLGFVSTIVLARLLTPADYGVIALAMIFVGLLDAFTAFGFDVVLIQDQEAPPEKYHCVWTLTVIRGVTLAAVTFLAAPLCADFFAEPALSRVLQLLALATLVGAFENTATVDFRKNLQFDREFRLMVYPKVIGFVVTVALAVAWRDYWALAVGMVVTRLIAVITGYVMRPYRPVPCLEHWAEIFRFSKWLMANSILRYGYNNSESMVLGKLMGSAAVGAYAIANEIAMMVSSELVAPIQRAILPGYAKLARSENGLRDAYLAVLGVTNVVGLPVSAGIALTADLFVPLLLGDKWAQTIPLIQILSVAVVLRLGLANSGTVYVVSGKPWLTTLLSVISLAGGIPLRVCRLGCICGAACRTRVHDRHRRRRVRRDPVSAVACARLPGRCREPPARAAPRAPARALCPDRDVTSRCRARRRRGERDYWRSRRAQRRVPVNTNQPPLSNEVRPSR